MEDLRKANAALHITMLTISKKRLKWSNESMVKAIDAVKSGHCSIKWAAEDYKVPRTTLQDRELLMEKSLAIAVFK